MYTRCPRCGTTFGIGAAQLSEGRGRARCGACLEVFDALPALSDEIPPEPPPDVRDAASEPTAAGATDADSPPPLLAGPGGDREDEAPARRATAGRARTDPAPGPGAEGVPEALREDLLRLERGRREARLRFAFSAGCVVLVALLAGQHAWFSPDDVIARYPQSRPLIERFCEHAGCSLPERRDPGRIELVRRDVRVHPRYEGALLITATLRNGAPYAQPYPRMQFTLFNVNGQVIATRRFEAEEYLGDDVDVERGMPAGRPVQVALDVLAPDQAAVSFEFRFL